MPDEPQIGALSKKRRHYLFLVLLTTFLVALPVMIFYTTGYRLSFENDATSIVTTGGMYVTADDLEVSVFLDDKRVDRPRLFRSAYYIQDIEAGQHRVVVQRPDLQTWVKELPIDPRIVIEVAAFNMPVIPHIRPISQFVDNSGTALYPDVASGTVMFPKATTTEAFVATTSIFTLGYQPNEEFYFVESLFSTTSTTTRSVFERIIDGVDRFRFSTTTDISLDEATTTEDFIERGDIRLVEKDKEIYAVWLGDLRSIPHYFCVVRASTSTIAKRYGDHVSVAIDEMLTSTTTPIIFDDDRLCRPQVKLNHLAQDVYFYDFFPNSSDLVLLQLEDGLYVTEIDDRAWQNTQLLYPGNDFRVVVENDIIYINEDKYYFELITQIEPS